MTDRATNKKFHFFLTTAFFCPQAKQFETVSRKCFSLMDIIGGCIKTEEKRTEQKRGHERRAEDRRGKEAKPT